MRLILKDYIETFKEEQELESLLENILIMRDFTNIIRPQKGVTQFGVDFYAEKKNNIYLFVLKQKDIDKTNWDTGNNAVRPTLNEILDSYIPQRLKDCQKRINIVLCTNGIIKQNVMPSWDGFINNNSTEKIKFEFWGIDELTHLTEDFLLNEYIFEEDIKSDLRKALYFSEEDISLRYYNQLLNKLIVKIASQNIKNKIYKKALTVYILIVKMCISYSINSNVKIAVKMSEKALIEYWNFISEKNLYEQKKECEALIVLSLEYERCCKGYIQEIKKVYKFVPSFPIYNPLEHRMIIYEAIGIIATYTYYIHYFSYKGNCKEEINENIDILITLINNNYAFYYPIYDLHSIEINILISLLIELNYSQTSLLTENIFGKIIARMKISNYYPVGYEIYDKALDIEFNKNIDEFNATVLLTNLLEWLNIFEKNREIKLASDFLYKKFPNITFNTIEIDKEYEKEYFKGNLQKSIISYIIDYNKDILEINNNILKIYEKHKLEEYKYFQYNALPILFIVARHYRLPLPSNIIYRKLK